LDSSSNEEFGLLRKCTWSDAGPIQSSPSHAQARNKTIYHFIIETRTAFSLQHFNQDDKQTTKIPTISGVRNCEMLIYLIISLNNITQYMVADKISRGQDRDQTYLYIREACLVYQTQSGTRVDD